MRQSCSREIETRLFLLPEFQSARTIMFFASFRSEVDTVPMIRRALEEGKRVILPKVRGRELGLFEIVDYDRDMASGAWGIPEPRETKPANISDVELMVVPGLAFDLKGNRLGYGAGFYDRILPAYHRPTVALAFEVQIVPQAPAEAHDVPMQKIVTETRVIEVARTGPEAAEIS